MANSRSAPNNLCGAAKPGSVALLPPSKGAEAFCDPKTSRNTQILDVEFLVRKTLARDFPREAVNPYYGGGVSGTGNVQGPSVSTDNAVARFDGATGTRIQDSGLIVDDPAPITGYVVHTPDPSVTLAEPLVVRPGGPTGSVTGVGANLTLKGGEAGIGDPAYDGGNVEIYGGNQPAGGNPGQVNIGTTQTNGVTIGASGNTITLDGLAAIDPSIDLNTPTLAVQGDTNTGLAPIGNDILALVTNGAYRLAIDDVGVVEHTSGWRGPVFRTSGNVTLDATYNTVIVTGAHTVTLQAAPLGGFEVFVFNAHSAAITVGRNGKNINGVAADLSVPAGKGALLKWDATGNSWWTIASYNGLTAGTTGDVTGPASATDNALARFDGTTGKLIQNSDFVVDDLSGGVVEAHSTSGNRLIVRTNHEAGATQPLALNSGNSSAGASGNVNVDAGTAATTPGTVQVGVSNANAVTIGRTGKTTTINGTLALANPLSESNGGTNQSAYSTGDMLYASGANTLAKRAIGTTGQVLTVSGGVPTWATPATVDNGIMDFRLCGASGTPVPTSDTTTISTLYLTPYKGNRIALYYSSAWQLFTTAEVSKALSSLTSGKPYDVFAYYDGSAVQLEFLVWTNDTTRATALAYQDGILVKSGDATRRYIGSFYTTATNATTWVTVADVASTTVKAYIWNYYNRVRFSLRLYDSTNSYTYSSTIRQWNGSGNAQLNVLAGLAESAIDVTAMATCAMNSTGGAMFTCIGYDSTSSAPTGAIFHNINSSATNRTLPLSAQLTHQPGVGRHFYAWLQGTNGGATWTWYGDNGGTTMQSGMNAIWEA